MIAFTPLLPTNFDIGSAVDRARRLPRTRGLAMCYDDAFECTRQHSDGGTRRDARERQRTLRVLVVVLASDIEERLQRGT